jgi:hypothetical protein
MKHIIILVVTILLGLATPTMAQDQPGQTFTDAAGNKILLGVCPREALLENPFAQWFKTAYDHYTVDTATCVYLAPLLRDKKITLFLGTWCGDSRREVPRLLKILDCCGFPPNQLKLVMVSNQPDMYKQSPGHEEAGLNIRRVPTLIIEGKKQEMGRIIELPVVSLEKDMLRILRKEGYVPNYAETLTALPFRGLPVSALTRAGIH